MSAFCSAVVVEPRAMVRPISAVRFEPQRVADVWSPDSIASHFWIGSLASLVYLSQRKPWIEPHSVRDHPTTWPGSLMSYA